MQAHDSDDSGIEEPDNVQGVVQEGQEGQGVVQEGQGEELVEVSFANFLILLVPRHLRPPAENHLRLRLLRPIS